jgi:ATP-binding cassette subfamily B protein
MNERRKPERVEEGPRHGPGSMPRFGKPKDTRKTIQRLLRYLAPMKWQLAIVIVLMLINTASSLVGSYFLKPLINNYILPGDFSGLAMALVALALIYLVGVAAIFVQSRLMVQVAQRTANRMRAELFNKMQGLPLRYFDTHTHGDLMSRYTNDMDNVQMALEQSITQVISSALIFVGSIAMMLVLSPILFLVTAVVLVLMVIISQKIAGQSRSYYQNQQKDLGAVNGFVEEMVDGLKVVKVFNHEQDAIAEFKQLPTRRPPWSAVCSPSPGASISARWRPSCSIRARWACPSSRLPTR